MNVIIFAPIYNSLYSLIVTHLCLQEPGVNVAGIVIRKITDYKRIRSEFRRDGVRLLRKIWGKMILYNESSEINKDERTVMVMAREVGLPFFNLHKIARQNKIPLLVVKNLNDDACLSFLKERNPDLILFTGGGLIRKQILEIPAIGIFNVHMGLLPRYRGMDVVEWPILESASRIDNLGITLHLMDRGVDTGPIVASVAVEAKENDTIGSLRERYVPLMIDLMIKGVRLARDGKLSPRHQKIDEGKQYFVMHPRLNELALQKFNQLKSASNH